ncbi:hypothetical protein NDU88_002105 [Pleurodeles waltl]|uniref:Uncharacterized protein n=1 Tax=Pleurodeles waltl TaxID=8319 RepID=A0AAV7LZK3_PLEWA|nr:hypothetical protein NDU88_002105 [Pleurodeles waltl]
MPNSVTKYGVQSEGLKNKPRRGREVFSALELQSARVRDVSSWKIFTSWVCGSIIASANAIATSFGVDVVAFPAGSAEDFIGVRVDADAGDG